MAVKRWVVFLELTDDCDDPMRCLSEDSVREFINQAKKELPPSITLKIRGLTGPFAEYGKAAGAK